MTQEKKTDIALLLLRLYVGFAMFYGHGLRKMDKLFGERKLPSLTHSDWVQRLP